MAPLLTAPDRGEVELEIHTPAPDQRLADWQTSVEVVGGASVFGGVKFLDLILVLDTSQSLKRTDPRNYRTAGAVGLVKSLPPSSDLQIGVVDFDRNADLVTPLTKDRQAVVQALLGLDRHGRTDLASGVRVALEEFERNGRPNSSRVILLFTDGKSNAEKARRAGIDARMRGVAVHTLLLGSSQKGAEILQELAASTRASFIHVTDPESLPAAFLALRTTGIEKVDLRVNGSEAIPARLSGGTFTASVPLAMSANTIVARATSLDGRSATASVRVEVTGPISLAIETPHEGALFESREATVLIEGSVDALAGFPAEVQAAPAEWEVESVLLRTNGSEPVPALVEAGRFRARLRLQEGQNRIVATARSFDGRSVTDFVQVSVREPGCATLRVQALQDGKPALSISDRSVEIVFDASNSMWGRIDEQPKISIAKQTLLDALDWLPDDLNLALRVYGHRHSRELRNCTDSELLVPFGSGSRASIREAIAGFKPRGQTPLAYSLKRIRDDFGGQSGEAAVVLVTDGIESCGGDPAAAARALQDRGPLPVHVIGFGFSSEDDEDFASLRGIAEASGGRFLTARNADELRDALAATVGTVFRVLHGETVVAQATLGDDRPILLPAGDYRVQVDSRPPHEVRLMLTSDEALTLVLERAARMVSNVVKRGPTEYARCENPLSAGTAQPNATRAAPNPVPAASADDGPAFRSKVNSQ
jgi:Mg-chelatase subunit ChlD